MRLALGLLLLAACGGDDDVAEGPDAGPSRTVAEVADEDCATLGVRGLALQISASIRCDMPEALVPFAEDDHVSFTGSNVVPYLVPDGAAALAAVDHVLEVNSAFRTVAEQELLWQWADAGRCGISVAATPGRSNHESGRALDLANWAEAEAAMNAQGWQRDVPGDDVHFDYLAGADLRGLDVLAFQELWNANHPEDALVVDGDYGPATQSRLLASPANGFAIDLCNSARLEWHLLADSHPSR